MSKKKSGWRASVPNDVDAVLAKVSEELVGRFEAEPLEIAHFYAFRLKPHKSGAAYVDVFLDGDLLRVVGQAETRLDREFDNPAAEYRISQAADLIIRIGKYGLFNVRRWGGLGRGKAVVPSSNDDVRSIELYSGKRIVHRWNSW